MDVRECDYQIRRSIAPKLSFSGVEGNLRVSTMKKLNCLCVALALFALGVLGCKKNVEGSAVPEINGVKVDFPKLQHTFEGASPEIQQSVSETIQGVRYGMYEKSLEALDKLANDSNVNEEQKKVVNELIESVKQLMAKAPPAPPSQ